MGELFSLFDIMGACLSSSAMPEFEVSSSSGYDSFRVSVRPVEKRTQHGEQLVGNADARKKMSGSACVKQYFEAEFDTSSCHVSIHHKAGVEAARLKAFAEKPEEMKRLQDLLKQENAVAVEIWSLGRANAYGREVFLKQRVQTSGLVVDISAE